MQDDILTPLHNDESLSDPKLEALRQYTLKVIGNKGWLAEDEIDTFLARVINPLMYWRS